MIFQHFNLLWSRTVLDNVLLPLEFSHVPKAEREARARELIKLVGLEGRENAYQVNFQVDKNSVSASLEH